MKTINYKVYKHYFAESFWGTRAGGCLFLAQDTGRLMVVLRSRDVNEPHTWANVGGKIDEGEEVIEAVSREVQEEIEYHGSLKLNKLTEFKSGNFVYYNFLGLVPKEFTPILNWESDDFKWIEYGEWSEIQPMHFGLKYIIDEDGDKIKNIIDRLNVSAKTV
jgi:8-oxo-dGTP pyrophosphatase MutT (NUDIX family)